MKEDLQLVVDTTNRIFADLCTSDVVDSAESGAFAAELWRTLEDNGLTQSGEYSFAVMREAARYAAPLPLAELFVVKSLLGDTELASGPVTIAVGEFDFDGQRLSGSASDVAFARWCDRVYVLSGNALYEVASGSLVIEPAVNMAGEPRDHISVDAEPLSVTPVGENAIGQLKLSGAASRVVMMSGAMESALSLAVDYAMTRQQFGRSISKFQAIQQQLAVLAGEVAASIRATDALIMSDLSVTEVAIAKARVGEACSQVCDIAHQVHGAIGYTLEHSLNQRTRRLWCWRDEYGNERYWQERLGQEFCLAGADELWTSITRYG